MPNLELRHKRDLSSFRRIAIGTWKTAYDPKVYGRLVLDVGEALRYVEAFRAATGRRLTISHLVCRAMAQVFVEMPDANAVLRFNRIYLRERIGLFFQVAMEDEETGQIDLSGVVVREPERKTLVEIIDVFEAEVRKVRAREDENLEQTRSLFKRIPSLLLGPFLNGLGFLSFGLNLDLSRFGMPKDPFGSAMITNIGSLGIDEAYVPIPAYSRVPLVIALGAVRDEAVVRDGRVEAARVINLHATFDHRILDGAHCAVMARTLRRWLEHPFEHFDPIEGHAVEGAPPASP